MAHLPPRCQALAMRCVLLLLPLLALSACAPGLYAPGTLPLSAAREAGHVEVNLESTASLAGVAGSGGVQYSVLAAPVRPLLLLARGAHESHAYDLEAPYDHDTDSFAGRHHTFAEGGVGGFLPFLEERASLSLLLGYGRGRSTSWG